MSTSRAWVSETIRCRSWPRPRAMPASRGSCPRPSRCVSLVPKSNAGPRDSGAARLFGTDGVRGKAGQYPLDAATIRRLGAALVRAMRREPGPVRLLSGRDTRQSGLWIEEQLAGGIRSQGGILVSAGVIPTPAIAYLTPRMAYTAGVVISASHNPFEDNGIKVFSGTGAKFTETLEAQVEAIVADTSWDADGAAGSDPAVEEIDYRSEYIAHLLRIFQPDHRDGVPIVIDCANGATT